MRQVENCAYLYQNSQLIISSNLIGCLFNGYILTYLYLEYFEAGMKLFKLIKAYCKRATIAFSGMVANLSLADKVQLLVILKKLIDFIWSE